MSLIAPPAHLPELQPIPVTVLEVTRYNDEQFPEEDGTFPEKIRVVLVPTGAGLEDGKIFVSGKPSWSPKGNLLPLVQAASARQLSQDELYALDPDEYLPGKELVVIGSYPEGSNYFKVSAYMRTAPSGKAQGGLVPQRTAGPMTQAAIDQGGVVVTPQRTSQQSTAVPAEGGAPVEAEVNIDDVPF